MQARGPLMVEHRLVERMIDVLQRALEHARQIQSIDPYLVDAAVDFIRVYADRTHHGKEEDIMFRELEQKALSPADRQVMAELIEEHIFGRTTTRALVEANTRYRHGDRIALADVILHLERLVAFYPQHIQKEDRVFFPAAQAYLSENEDQAMIAAFWEFDRKMIHEKYKALVEGLEAE
jgi:hemerythrin-like domain-containing protein